MNILYFIELSFNKKSKFINLEYIFNKNKYLIYNI